MAEGLEAVCPCAHVLGSPRTDTACVIERCECDDALYYDDADACEDLSALGALEERNGSMELYVGAASVAKSPIAIAQFVCGFARSCGACGVLGGVDGGAGNGELAGLAWAAIGSRVRHGNSKSQPGARRWRVVVGIGCVNQE